MISQYFNRSFMKTTNLAFYLTLPFLLFAGVALGQAPPDTVAISAGGPVDGILCNSQVILTDSGGADGDYDENESFVITLCIDESSVESNSQFIISPGLYGHTWDVDGNSTLFIYDGIDTDAPLIGAFNSETHPFGIIVEGTGRCLTFEFVSGPESSGAGFTGSFACPQPLQPFTFYITAQPNFEPFHNLEHNAIKICLSDSISIQVHTSYPLSDAGGYEQSDETSLFHYDMGDGSIYQGYGMTEINHTYSDPFGYLVTIMITDVAGKVEIKQLYVLIAPKPHFSNIPIEDTLCIGEETEITGGIVGTDTVGVSPATSAILGGGIMGEQIFLPDGNNVNYETTISIDEFEPDQVITSISDIVSMCVNMEHSFLGDLEMMLTCPDGTSVNIFNAYYGTGLFGPGFGGGGTFMGDANDDGSNAPGIGFTYCWSSDDPEFGTLGDEWENDNTVPVNTFQPGYAMAPGTYTPEQSFSEFIGCPINGDWTLTVRDNWSIDNGWIFNWSIYFDPNINPTTVYFSPDIDSVYWGANPDIVQDLGTSILVNPSNEGDNAFTFFAVDEFGCVHDTTINVYVRPYVEIEDNIACDLTHTLVPVNAPGGAVWTTIVAPTETATAQFTDLGVGAAEVVVDEYGIYNFEMVDNNCSYTDTAAIDFRPNPQIAPLIQDTILCIGADIVLDAGPQQANSEHFSIVWTRDGEAFNTSDLAVTINQTGNYVVYIVGVCGEASDTSNVVAIELEIEGDTIFCGPENPYQQVTITPEGSGFWSSSSNAISFDTPNEVYTKVFTDQYGTFPITYTDNRCLDDGYTRQLTFVEQPVVKITPQYPDFCLESDSLKLVASVNGSHNGDFLWAITSNSGSVGVDNDQDNKQLYPPETFDPLEIYTFMVTVYDAYGVCPAADTSVAFEGKACVYNIPNVISPNGDGKNDKFQIQFIESFPSTRLRIYNRWGNVIFEQDDYDRYQEETGGWAPDKDLAPGVYFYELSIPYANKIETGNLTILESDGK